MEKEKIIDQIKLHSLRTTAKNLKCSYTTLRYWINKYQIILPPLHTKCNRCGNTLDRRKSGPARKLCEECKKHFRKIGYVKKGLGQLEKQIRRKAFLIKELGGKCSKCGYDKNISALHFHHLDPREKDFNMNSRKLSNLTLLEAKIELKKCIILCGNCHSDHHYPAYSNWKNIELFW